MAEIKQAIRSPMSDADVRKILGDGIKIVRYSDLSSLASLDELLTNSTDACVLLYETDRDVGHWTGLLKYDGLYEFFDAYGMFPDRELRWIPASRRKLLGMTESYLTDLLDRSDRHWVYNKTRYQRMDDQVNTCGDHVAHRIYRLMHNDMDLKDYSEYMEHVKEKFHTSYDVIVAEFVEDFGVS